ncbi:MAG: adenylate/guanylate cyclase domain-containing protein [Bacteroidota bacterium]
MTNRQLSAIMFTDLAGFTAMMQENEFDAKDLRDRHRRILEEKISHYNGKILQYYGDGALSLFSSTVSASDSAVSIQKASIADKIPLRIGIHTGDVVIEEDGVYGDGVNIASRIESFSVPGSVMVSDKVYDDLKNHDHFRSVLMGEFELKNVKKPVEVYALTNEGLIVPQRTELKGKVKERIKSIMVLPFVNRSADPENEYFSDGITEEIITSLAKVDGLRVISRTSSFAFKGKNADIREIGKQLEVQSVLDGSVRKAGNKVRISVQLSSTFDGYELWSETYDRLLEDIFELQDEISLKITHQLRERLSSSKIKDKDKVKPVNVEAYNHYLQGLFYYNKWTPANAQKAQESFQKAIDLVPAYDQAIAGQALSYSLMSMTGFMKPTTGYKLTKEKAERVLNLNAQNESAYIALSYYEFFYAWNFNKSKEYAEKALELNPRSPDANVVRTLVHLARHEVDESIKYIDKAKEIDPLSAITNRTLADFYYLKGDYKRSIEVYDWILERYPDFIAALEFKAWAYLMLGEHTKAIDLFNSISGDAVHAIKPYVQLGYAYAIKGEMEKATSYLDQLKKEAQQNPEGAYDMSFATLYTGLGMIDEAFIYLRRCMEEKIGAVTMINISPIWKPLHKDARYLDMLKEIGLETKP